LQQEIFPVYQRIKNKNNETISHKVNKSTTSETQIVHWQTFITLGDHA